MADDDTDGLSNVLTIPAETAFFIIVKAREFDSEVALSDPDSGSNPTDDGVVDILEETSDSPTERELRAALASLNIDERLDLLALTWLGRGDFSDFAEARKDAEALSEVHAVRYLLGTPQLGDYLEEGLSQLGVSLEDFEINRL
jgi:hypothetical protein